MGWLSLESGSLEQPTTPTNETGILRRMSLLEQTS